MSIEPILASELFDANQKREFLVAEADNGAPGLFMAMQNNHPVTITAFIEHILASDIFDTNQKLELIAAKTSDGTPGLFIALQEGNSEAITAFIKPILASDQFDANKGYTEIVDEFINAILNTNKLTFNEKQTALQETKALKYHGCQSLIENNNVLNEEQKNILLDELWRYNRGSKCIIL